jgi:hypothetical protein
LESVAAVSRNNVWAVGFSWTGSLDLRPLIEHWNGNVWRIVTSPGLKPEDRSALTGVAALSPNNIWAIGERSNTKLTGVGTLAEHWNGKRWRVVSTPGSRLRPGHTNGICTCSLAAISPHYIWAANSFMRRPDGLQRWTGTRWVSIRMPHAVVVSSLAALSARDAWAFGYSLPAHIAGPVLGPAWHWNGKRWAAVAMPPVRGRYGNQVYDLFAAVAISSSDVWVVGRTSNDEYDRNIEPVIEHWNGKRWTIVES